MVTGMLRGAVSFIFKRKDGSVRRKLSHLVESNRPPTENESQLIWDLIQQLDEEVQVLAKEGSPSSGLTSRIETLNRQIECYTSVLSIIRTIPPEIIQHIFLLSDISPLTLSHICREWRQYAQTFARLWTTLPEVSITVGSPRKTMATLEMLTVWLRLTSNAPLNIWISHPYLPHSMSMEQIYKLSESPVLALLVSQSDRWRSAKLTLPEAVIAELTPAMKGHLAALQSLSINFTETYIGNPWGRIAEIHTFSDTPQLRMLHTQGKFSGEIILTDPELAHLTCGWPSDLSVSSLTLFASLESLHIHINGSPRIRVLQNQVYAPPTPISPVSLYLPFLKRLSGDFFQDDNFALLKALTIPSITEIDIALRKEGGLQELINMLIRSGQSNHPTLRRFKLQNGHDWLFQPGEVVSLLRLMQELEDLEISMPHHGDVLALARTNFDGSGELLVPRLERCMFQVFHTSSSNIPTCSKLSRELCDAIKTMARNRCEWPRYVDQGVRPLQLFEVGGRSFFYNSFAPIGPALALSQRNPLYTQADFEYWPTPSSAQGSSFQKLMNLHDALLEQIPALYLDDVFTYVIEDMRSSWKRRVGTILNSLEALTNEELSAFDILTSDFHIIMEKLARGDPPTVPGGSSFPQAGWLAAKWNSLIFPHLNELHWAFVKTQSSPKRGYAADRRSLIYVRNDHPVRACMDLSTTGFKMDGKSVGFLSSPTDFEKSNEPQFNWAT